MNDEELAEIIIAGFLSDIPLQILALKQHLQTGDIAATGRQAHRIKGASANISAEALRVAAHDIENCSSLELVHEKVTHMELQFDQLKAVLHKELYNI